MNNKRIDSVDIFKAIGILLMIMGHIGFGGFFSKWIHAFHMPMFFIISGFFISSYSPNFLNKKILGLIVPYFFIGLFHIVIFVFITKSFSNRCIYTFLWECTDNIPIAGALWFLPSLFLAELIYSLIIKNIPSINIQNITIGIISITGMALPLFLSIRLPWALDVALSCTGFIHFGKYLQEHKEKLLKLNPYLCTVLFLILTITIYLNGDINLRLGQYSNWLLYWVNAIGMTVILWNFSQYLEIFLTKFIHNGRFFIQILIKIGKNSLYFLCFNQLCILFTSNLFNHITVYSNNKLFILLAKLGILLLVTFECYIIHYIFTLTPCKIFIGKNKNSLVFFKNTFTIFILFLLSISSYKFIKNQKYKENLKLEISKIHLPDEFIAAKSSNNKLDSLINNSLNYITNYFWIENQNFAFQSSSKIPNKIDLPPIYKTKIEKSKKSFINWENTNYLYIPLKENRNENAIRPWSHISFTMASADFFKCLKVNDNDFRQKTCKLISSLAKIHCSNYFLGWGDEWQSAEWAENIGFGAWLEWDNLTLRDKINIANMIIHEADRFINYKVPYYKDKSGKTLFKGDTKGEENAWNSRILALAYCMFPEHEHANLWYIKLLELLLSSSARPTDANSTRTVDGIVLNQLLNGSNINEDGTVTNHGLYHIDYMTTVYEGMSDSIFIFLLAGKKIPAAALFNLDIVYDCLVNKNLGNLDSKKEGHHFYERNENEEISSELNMPGKNDWGGKWYGNCYLIDTEVELFKLDSTISPNLKAHKWAETHLSAALNMQNREINGNTTGQFFQKDENNFISGETYMIHSFMKAYMLRKMALQNPESFILPSN